MVEGPDEIVPILQEANVIPPELPKKLLPRRPIDHLVKLVPGAKSPTQVPYHMTPPKLVELRKQLTKLLDTWLIQPSKGPYGASIDPSFFHLSTCTIKFCFSTPQ